MIGSDTGLTIGMGKRAMSFFKERRGGYAVIKDIHKFKKWARRYGLWVMVLIAVPTCGWTAIELYAAKDDAVFELSDVYGPRSALEGITISGALADMYHRTEFRITADGVDRRTVLHDVDGFKQADYYAGWPFDDKGYMYVKKDRTVEIWEKDRGKMWEVPSGHIGRLSNQRHYGNPVEYGLASAQDLTYFLFPNSLYYEGTALLYELGPGKPRPIASFEIKGNDADRGTGLEVLGLEAVGERLVVLMAEDRKRLIVRALDRRSGAVLGEVAVEGMLPGYSPQYLAFPDDEQRLLHLVFEERESGRSEFKLLGFDVSDSIGMTDVLRFSIGDSQLDDWRGRMTVRQASGKIVVVTIRPERQEHSSAFITPDRFMIDVFENGKRIYTGELLTDQADDLIQFPQSGPHSSLFYDRYNKVRGFEIVGIE